MMATYEQIEALTDALTAARTARVAMREQWKEISLLAREMEIETTNGDIHETMHRIYQHDVNATIDIQSVEDAADRALIDYYDERERITELVWKGAHRVTQEQRFSGPVEDIIRGGGDDGR